MAQRMSKDAYYLGIAEAVLQRSTCLRRKYGAIIVKEDEIIATGYNGAPRGEENCSDCGFCYRESLGIPKGERYELCKSVHAEQNAIISAARRDDSKRGYCPLCRYGWRRGCWYWVDEAELIRRKNLKGTYMDNIKKMQRESDIGDDALSQLVKKYNHRDKASEKADT